MTIVEIQLIWAWASIRVQALRADARESGEVLPWVIMTALLAAAAIVVVAIIVQKATQTANNTKTQ